MLNGLAAVCCFSFTSTNASGSQGGVHDASLWLMKLVVTARMREKNERCKVWQASGLAASISADLIPRLSLDGAILAP